MILEPGSMKAWNPAPANHQTIHDSRRLAINNHELRSQGNAQG